MHGESRRPSRSFRFSASPAHGILKQHMSNPILLI
jgi:hypothetical protein